MIYLHFLAAILATWRLTDLMTHDRITEKLRAKLNTYLWSCPRCMSVWCGGLCALMFVLGPVTHDWTRWALWPFALSWLYIWRIDNLLAKRLHDEGRRLVFESRGPGWQLTRNDFQEQETQQILSQALTAMIQQRSTPPVVPPAAPEVIPPAHVNGSAK